MQLFHIRLYILNIDLFHLLSNKITILNTCKYCLRWLDIVFILCARTSLLDLWGVKRILFLHAQLQNLDFVNLLAIFLPLFLQFPLVNFFKIWQLGKTRFQFDDEHFKFTNQKL